MCLSSSFVSLCVISKERRAICGVDVHVCQSCGPVQSVLRKAIVWEREPTRRFPQRFQHPFSDSIFSIMKTRLFWTSCCQHVFSFVFPDEFSTKKVLTSQDTFRVDGFWDGMVETVPHACGNHTWKMCQGGEKGKRCSSRGLQETTLGSQSYRT